MRPPPLTRSYTLSSPSKGNSHPGSRQSSSTMPPPPATSSWLSVSVYWLSRGISCTWTPAACGLLRLSSSAGRHVFGVHPHCSVCHCFIQLSNDSSFTHPPLMADGYLGVSTFSHRCVCVCVFNYHLIIYFRKFLSLFISLYFWPCLTACGILVPRPGVEPVPPELEAWSLDQ